MQVHRQVFRGFQPSHAAICQRDPCDASPSHIQRLQNLEDIGTSFEGVEKCFAFQAGREVRVVVSPKIISDEQAYELCRKIVRKIEDDLQYPGQIRVTVIRETRCVEFAK